MEGRLKILRVMNSITNNINLKKFAQMVGLTQNQTLGYVKELVNMGLLKKIGRGFAITEEAKITLKAVDPVPKGMEFRFYTGIGQCMGLSAESLKDFCELVKKVDVATLEFHISRGDFENWIKSVFNDAKLADDFTKIKKSKLKGESLKNEIVKATEARYHDFEKIISP